MHDTGLMSRGDAERNLHGDIDGDTGGEGASVHQYTEGFARHQFGDHEEMPSLFADVDEATFNIDPKSLERAIAKAKRLGLKARAIIPVDLEPPQPKRRALGGRVASRRRAAARD